MRGVRFDPDGKPEVSTALTQFSRDRDRYDRFRAGESVADICVKDGIEPEKALKSISQGRRMVEAEQILELRDLNHSSAVAIARLKTKARVQNETLLLDGLEKLLKGERTVASVLKETGEIVTRDITDPEVISMGIEHARKIFSIDERPTQNTTTVNIQNNQQNVTENYGGEGSAALSYEERVKRIRNSQTRIQTETRLLDAETIDVTPIVPEPTEEAKAPEPGKEWENF
jgi:hypothetical protein